MARKETPDVLAELLGGPTEALSNPASQPTPAKPKAAPRAAKPKAATQQAAHAPAAATPAAWDYLVISFSEYRGWRPRFINGQEIRNWMQAPLIHDYLSQLGEDGWEMTGAGGGKALYGSSDYYQVFFKRAKR